MWQILWLCWARWPSAVSWLLMRWSKDPARRAQHDHAWGLADPVMQPHWDRLWAALRRPWCMHDVLEAMKNLGTEWCRFNSEQKCDMRSFKALAFLWLIDMVVVAAVGFAMGRWVGIR